jgi:putative polyhydroxyalkanoate system protein
MATIDIRRNHTLGVDGAKKKAEELANDMKEKLSIQWRWDGNNIKFDTPSGMAKGTTGTVTCGDTSIRVEIDLPFLLRPMKGTVEGKVNDKLDKALAAG